MRLPAAAMVLLLGCASVRPQGQPEGTVVPSPAPPGSPLAPSSDAKPGLQNFTDLTAGAVRREGVLETYEKSGRLYLVVPRERLGAPALDAYARAHFAESAARISKVLDAELHEGP